MNTSDLTLYIALAAGFVGIVLCLISFKDLSRKNNIFDYFAPAIVLGFMGAFLPTITIARIIVPTEEVLEVKCLQEQKVIKMLKKAHKNQPRKYGHRVLLDNGQEFKVYSNRNDKVLNTTVCTKTETHTKEYYLESSFNYSTKVVVKVENQTSQH